MVKKAKIIVPLLPKAPKVANESLKAETKKEIQQGCAPDSNGDQLKSIKIEEN
jgi:hypothetical protein